MSERGDCYAWRLIATGISYILFGIGALVLGYLVFPLVSLCSNNRQLANHRCRRLIQLGFRFLVSWMRVIGLLTWEVAGRADLERPGQLVVANHPSLIDVVFLIALVPDATCIVKAQLFRNIFTRGPVSRAGYIPNTSPEQIIQDCSTELARGASLIVFPEGTRSRQHGELRFQRGAAYVWLQTHCHLSLVTITSRPPTLSKEDKWYQIPPVRPHFKLRVSRPAGGDGQQPAPAGEHTARSLTRQWQQHFTREIST